MVIRCFLPIFHFVSSLGLVKGERLDSRKFFLENGNHVPLFNCCYSSHTNILLISSSEAVPLAGHICSVSRPISYKNVESEANFLEWNLLKGISNFFTKTPRDSATKYHMHDDIRIDARVPKDYINNGHKATKETLHFCSNIRRQYGPLVFIGYKTERNSDQFWTLCS